MSSEESTFWAVVSNMKAQVKILCLVVCLLGFIDCVPLEKTNANASNIVINTETGERRRPAPPIAPVHKVELPDVRSSLAAAVNTTVLPAKFGVNYTNTVNSANLLIFAFSYNKSNGAVRVLIQSGDANVSFPLLVVVRQQEGILSWQIPLVLDHVYAFSHVGRTLCPGGLDQMAAQQQIFVDISSLLPQELPPLQFSLRADLLDDFVIKEGKEMKVNITPSEPQYFLYTFPEGTESVMLTVTSPDQACMTVSVQPSSCPVFDLDSNVAFDGKYMTMTQQSSLFLQRRDYSSGKFFVVLVMKPGNLQCAPIETILPAGPTRSKSIAISVTRAISRYQYLVGVLTAAGILLGIILIAVVFVGLSRGCGYYSRLQQLVCFHQAQCLECPVENLQTSSSRSSFSSDDVGRPLLRASGSQYGSLEASANGRAERMEEREEESPSGEASGGGDDSSTSSLDTSDIDFLHDANEEKDIYRTKVSLVVSDLARKKGKKLDKIYKIYHWNLLTISIFYGLPVIQLVITYQLVLQNSGNQDLCYYNFDCAHPLGPVSSFNNVYSNIGYVVLGALFIVIVYIRDKLHKWFCKEYSHLDAKYGLPQHFGLYYAMGLALMMEGVMSACYHMCPNYSNFQFDTSFMYIIACLCILKIYQNRHPDVNAKAHASYLFMSIIILIAVLGVVYGDGALWIAYGCIHMLVALVLSANIYYMSRWTIDRHLFKRIFLTIRTDGIRCAKPAYPDRFILLFVGNAINWTFALYGAITQPSDFATYLLAVFIGNLLLYVLFYIIMKLRSGERLPNLALASILCSAVIWGFSLYFFLTRLTSWNMTPAMSREKNRPCVLLEFYDMHDVWHFLSALSLFLSFMILLTLDDDLITVERCKIPVF